MLFGLVWMVDGALLLLISPIQLLYFLSFALPAEASENSVVSIATAIFRLLAGFLLYRYGVRLASHAA